MNKYAGRQIGRNHCHGTKWIKRIKNNEDSLRETLGQY